MVASDTPDNLTRLMAGTNTVSMTVKGPQTTVKELLDTFPEIKTSQVNEIPGSLLSVKIESAAETDLREKLFFAFADAKLPILAMSSATLSLEDIFIKLTSEEAAPKKTKKKKKVSVTEKEADSDESNI